MEYKAVFHMDLKDENRLNTGLSNLNNLLFATHEFTHDLVVVFNGLSVNLMTRENSQPFVERIRELHSKGVRFQVCQNSLNKLQIPADHLIEECEIIPAGIVALIDLQNNGFSYIKP